MGPGPVLVTGGGGFVGANVVRRLLAGGATVHVLLKDDADPWRLAEIRDRVTIHPVDLLDGGAVRRAFAAIAPASVFHLATHGAYERQACLLYTSPSPRDS